MKLKKSLRIILAIMMTVVITAGLAMYAAPADAVLTAEAASTKKKENKAYKKIMAMEAKYPEGTSWTEANSYRGKTACQAFAFMMSDTGYGKKAKYYTHYDFGVLKTGDIIFQVPGTTTSDGATTSGTHALVVLKADYANDKLILAEGNYNGTVHWNGEFTISEFAGGCGQCVVSRFAYDEKHKAKIKKPKQVKKVTYGESDGYGHFYAEKPVSCTKYQFLISNNKKFPYTSTMVAYSAQDTNYVYWKGGREVWGNGFVKVRAVNISGGKVSYGKWSKVMKIN